MTEPKELTQERATELRADLARGWTRDAAEEALDGEAFQRRRADKLATELEAAKITVTNGAMVKCSACGSDAFNVCTHLLGDMVTAPAERDDLQKRLDKAVDILNMRHLGAGAMKANEETRKVALEFIRVELEARGR